MFCTQCGNKMDDGDGFCGMCGAARPSESQYQVQEDAPTQLVNAEQSAQVLDVPPTQRIAPASIPESPANPAIPNEPVSTPPSQSVEAPSSASNRKTVYIAAAILAAAIAIAAAVVLGGFNLGASDGSVNSDSAAATSNSASATQADDVASSSQPAEGEQSAEEKQSAEEEPSADRIYADGFSFELPEYWKGKVVGGKIDGGVALYPDTAMGCVEGYELVKLTLVSADAPENAGDYVTHVAGRVRGDGVRVDVISKNWPAFYGGDWYRHPNYAGSSQEQEMAAALIDLSSGGACNYSDVRSAAENAANDTDSYAQFQSVDVDFLNETLIPTVKLDGADNASDGGAATAGLSDEEYENIAQAFAMQMFSSAEDTGDGAMRWIGCDSALEFVKPGSDAEACEFWEDTTFHVYLRVGKEAKITKTVSPRHYEVEAVYESVLDATGANRQANIATIEVGLDESGYVEDLEVVRLA